MSEYKNLSSMNIRRLQRDQPCIAEFIDSIGLTRAVKATSVKEWINSLSDEDLADGGMARDMLLPHMQQLLHEVDSIYQANQTQIETLTIIGGRNKQGEPENIELTIQAGDIVCIVGPTGSGKSCLLSDIECLAQGDTPTRRQIFLNGAPADYNTRFSMHRKMVAQLSQNMNFVVDLSVHEFITMHAHCRLTENIESTVQRVIDCANDLTGEKFSYDCSITQLSGGQTRALMIADTALLGAAPIVLIDEIENAGVDRKRALDLLVSEDKIVFISTHDPLLALRGKQRIVIQNGGIAKILPTSREEKENLKKLEEIESIMLKVRDDLRFGKRIFDLSSQ